MLYVELDLQGEVAPGILQICHVNLYRLQRPTKLEYQVKLSRVYFFKFRGVITIRET